MKKFISLIFSILICFGCDNPFRGDDEVLTFKKTFGSAVNDIGTSIRQTSDGGYIVTGIMGIFGTTGRDAFLLKLDKQGNEEWRKLYGGATSDRGTAVNQTTDNGYILAGTDQDTGAWLLKVNSEGIEEWDLRLSGTYPSEIRSLVQSSDGVYVVTGFSTPNGIDDHDIFAAMIDKNGSLLWEKAYGNEEQDQGYSIAISQDGAYVITGYTFRDTAGGYDIFLLKIDENGEEVWINYLGGDGGEWGYSIQSLNDGGYIISGHTWSFGSGRTDLWLLKTNASGVEEWSHAHGGIYEEEGYAVDVTDDGGYIIVGNTGSYGEGRSDIWMVKTDINGNMLWNKTFGDSGVDIGFDVQQTDDGGYILVGYQESTDEENDTNYDIIVIKTDSEGNVAE